MEDKQIQTSLTEKIPEWKLKLAYFRAEHKVLLSRIKIFGLFFIDIIAIFLFGSVFINYQTGLIRDEANLRQMSLNLVNVEAVNKQRPENLIFQEVMTIPQVTNNKYNLLVSVKNNNEDWAITELDYTFEVDGRDLPARTSFILPKSEKYLMYFNVAGSSDVSLKILNTQWQKVKDFSLLSYKDKVEVSGAVYKTSRLASLAGEVEFKLLNNTPYSFWEVGLPIVLLGENSKPIGIDYILVNKLLSQEEREISIAWHEMMTERVREVIVYPEINLLDSQSIMPPEGPIGSPPGRE